MDKELTERELSILRYFKQKSTCSYIPEYEKCIDDYEAIISVMEQMARDGIGDVIRNDHGGAVGLSIDINTSRMLERIDWTKLA